MRYTCHIKTKKITTTFKQGDWGTGPTTEIEPGECNWWIEAKSEEHARNAWEHHRKVKHPKPEPEPVQEL